MRATVYHAPGDVRVENVPDPVLFFGFFSFPGSPVDVKWVILANLLPAIKTYENPVSFFFIFDTVQNRRRLITYVARFYARSYSHTLISSITNNTIIINKMNNMQL